MISSTCINNSCAIHNNICARDIEITSKGDMCCSCISNGGIIIFGGGNGDMVDLLLRFLVKSHHFG